MKIKDISNSDIGSKINITVTVKYPNDKKSYSKGEYQKPQVTDGTGTMYLTIWNPDFDLEKGMKLDVTGAKVGEYKGIIELSVDGKKVTIAGDDKNETPKATIPQRPVDPGDSPGDVTRQVMGVPVPTDITPLTNELGKLVIVAESLNTKLGKIVDAFQVSRSPEVDGALGETITTQITEKFDFKFNKLESEIDALKDKVKENTKKLGKAK